MLISTIIGWLYFVAWSVSFYPQIWDNFRRRSVVGLNFDYVALNLTGFISYSVYNVSLYYIRYVQDQFEARHPHSQIPVEFNDVIFGLHAVFATLIVIVQCFLFERAEQRISYFAQAMLAVIWVGYVVIGFIVSFSEVLTLLEFLYIFSYVKLTITIVKYIPQVNTSTVVSHPANPCPTRPGTTTAASPPSAGASATSSSTRRVACCPSSKCS